MALVDAEPTRVSGCFFSPTICAYAQAKRRTETTLAEEVADSGFCEDGFLRHLEHQQLRYTAALKMVRPLQHRPVSATWWPLQDTDDAGKPATKVPGGIELCEFEYQSDSWDRPRRVIGIRQHIKLRDQAKGKNLSLFEDDPDLSQWRYGAIVTNLGLSAVEIWRLYRGRADCENHIKELKYDFALGTLARQNF